MLQRSIAIPRLLLVESGCLTRVGSLLSRHPFSLDRICVCSGNGPSAKFADEVTSGLAAVDANVLRVPGMAGQLDQAADLAALIIREGVSLVVGVGGGRVIDTGKLAAARTSIDFVSVPTTIAHDGISSPVASLAQGDGARQSYPGVMPAGIILDTEVVSSAPERTRRAGVGDLASNLTAVLDWGLADRLGHDRFDAFPAIIAESAARPILELDDLTLPESHEVIAKGLLLSGLAMAAAGTSRPCSGAEHLISHSLDGLLGDRAAMHGEQVALGCLFAAAAHGSPLLRTLGTLFEELGLPTQPEHAGISRQEMIMAIRRAPETRPQRYTVLSEGSASEGVEDIYDRAFRASGEQRG